MCQPVPTGDVRVLSHTVHGSLWCGLADICVDTVQGPGTCLPHVSPSTAQSHPSSSHRDGWQRLPGAFRVSEESAKSCLQDGAGLSGLVRPSHAARVNRQTLSPPCKGAFQSSKALGGDTVLVVPLGQSSPCSCSPGCVPAAGSQAGLHAEAPQPHMQLPVDRGPSPSPGYILSCWR